VCLHGEQHLVLVRRSLRRALDHHTSGSHFLSHRSHSCEQNSTGGYELRHEVASFHISPFIIRALLFGGELSSKVFGGGS